MLIVDQFTGRILQGRQFSEGLHQAIEAKEHVEIKKETITVATITYQNFFRMYSKLAGMTGTAKTEEIEFDEIYNMQVIEIPTNEPVVRNDAADYIYGDSKSKFEALIDDVERRHKLGQPVLVGTVAVETSEFLSFEMRKRRLPHEVLNAKNHEREAEIIEKAGQVGSITIATNMAGRGTDIKLGEGVVELGGLAVLGSERHESRRIDNQLRGRAGRQGDPGFSRFYLSGEDELLMRFGGDSFKNRITMLQNLQEDKSMPIESKLLTKLVANAQKRIENNNFDARKNVLKYDDVLRLHREIIYKERMSVLRDENIYEQAIVMLERSLRDDISLFVDQGRRNAEVDYEGLIKHFDGSIFRSNTFILEEINQLNGIELEDYVIEKAMAEIAEKQESIPPEIFTEFLKVILLRVIDTYWMSHIDTMSELRQGVVLQSYGQQNPLVLYQKEGYELFEELISNISRDVTKYILRANIQVNVERQAVVRNTATNEGDEPGKRKPRQRKNRGRRAPWQ